MMLTGSQFEAADLPAFDLNFGFASAGLLVHDAKRRTSTTLNQGMHRLESNCMRLVRDWLGAWRSG